MLQASVALNNDLLNSFLGFSTVEEYAQAKYAKPYSQLTPSQKYIAEKEFAEYFDGEKSYEMFKVAHIYNEFSKRFRDRLLEKDELLKSVTIDPTVTIDSVGYDFLKKKTRASVISRYLAELQGKEERTPEDEEKIAK